MAPAPGTCSSVFVLSALQPQAWATAAPPRASHLGPWLRKGQNARVASRLPELPV